MDTQADTPSTVGGGSGGPDHLTRSEMNLLARTLARQGPHFHVTEKCSHGTPEMMENIATSKRQCPRNRIAAARVLVEMVKVNMEQDKRDQQIPERVDLTSGGKPLDRDSLTAADIAAAAALVGVARAGIPSDGGPK